ncbi:MAG TPA: hypothetical protein VKC90_00635 [Chitinophagaceae bacterium]|nr:hypothetical protein [Chitinophagaceae bacterium]
MKNSRLRKYLEAKKAKNKPIRQKEEIQTNPDNKIDEDFKGYPKGPAKDETIKPKTKEQKKVADIKNKDGEKRNIKKKKEIDEQESNGSANAFDDK